MIIDNELHNALTASVRRIKGMVEFNGDSTSHVFAYNTNLKSFTIDREGVSNKFFGYGICQKLTVNVIDSNSELHLEGPAELEVSLGTADNLKYFATTFNFQEVSRDENTSELTITAYDPIYQLSKITVADLQLSPPYTMLDVATACGRAIYASLNLETLPSGMDISYPNGANLEGTENLREVCDAIAEATQSIYYVDNRNRLTFKPVVPGADPVLVIDKSQYFTLKSGERCVLTAICNATELGENVIAGTSSGYTQYVRENPFWTLRDDIADLVEAAVDRTQGLAAHKFSCFWRGNFLLEPGDKIGIIAKDDSLITSYFTNDKLTYNGGLSQTTEWSYDTNSNETAANPTTLGDKLKYTYAVVDKANKRIELVTSQVDDALEQVAQIEIDTNSIRNSVSATNKRIDEQDDEIADITKKVETQITPEQMTIAIKNEMLNGVDKITTSTGFTFNEEGLTVSKSGSEMTTTITEDGMSVYKDGNEVLTADNTGVKAENLHATTYLIIGKNSRFEDYNGNRTGCFWIGG